MPRGHAQPKRSRCVATLTLPCPEVQLTIRNWNGDCGPYNRSLGVRHTVIDRYTLAKHSGKLEGLRVAITYSSIHSPTVPPQSKTYSGPSSVWRQERFSGTMLSKAISMSCRGTLRLVHRQKLISKPYPCEHLHVQSSESTR